MDKIITYSFLIGILTISCKTVETVQQAYPLNEAEKLNYAGTVYALPKTSILTKVEVTKHSFVKGPYHEYAKEFLGITGVRNADFTKYIISGVEINPLQNPDAQYYYIALENKELTGYLSTLKTKGIILEIPDHNSFAIKNDPHQKNTLPDKPLYTDLSVKRNFREVYDTVYKTIIRDTVYKRIPVIETGMESKSIEQKAEEAANFIIKLRKRRFKLLTGQYDFYPEGEALKFAKKELDSLE